MAVGKSAVASAATCRGRIAGAVGEAAGDPAAQARQVFENLRRCLAQAGADFGNVVN